MKLALVVIAFNRPGPLERLLNSLRTAQTQKPDFEVTLIVSIDHSDVPEVAKIAESYQWTLGEKRVIVHPQSLGLKQHILCAGDLVEEFDALVMLEDDLGVSPYLWRYIEQSVAVCQKHREIGQVSLYSNVYNETAGLPFMPSLDGHNNYYSRVPSSWGQLWTKEQWLEFKEWLPYYELNSEALDQLLPPNVRKWPETSWKRIFQCFLIDMGKLVLYPRDSLTTNYADAGTHHVGGAYHFQTPLLTHPVDDYFLSSPDSSRTVYDEYSERDDSFFKAMILSKFNVSDVVIDLYGTRDLSALHGKFVITSQNVTGEKLHSFPLGLRPHELNLKENVVGEMVSHLSLIELQSDGEIASTPHRSEIQLDRYRYYHGLPKGILNYFVKLEIQRQRLQPFSRKDALKRLLPNLLLTLLKKIRSALRPSTKGE
jgi:hypothetical protein